MQAKIETLKARNSSDEEYLVYPRTLTKCVTNENGENLDVIISDSLKNSDITQIKGNVFIKEEASETDYYVPIDADTLGGHAPEYFATAESVANLVVGGGGGGASTAAEVSYDDTVGDIPFGADNVQDAFDNLKGILNTFDDYVNTKTSETLDAAKAYTDENAGASNASEISYDDSNVEGMEMNVDNVQGALDTFKSAFTSMIDMVDDALDEVLAEAKAYTDENIGSGGSSHQFSIMAESVLETGWYIIGRTMGIHSCNISIIDMGTMPGEEMPIFVQANVLSSEFVEALSSNVKILDVATYEGCAPYVGFDKIVTTRTEDDDIVVVMHYTNPGFDNHSCFLTITSLMGGEMTLFDDYSVNLGMQPYDGNTLTYLCDEFAEDALVGQVREFELKAQPDLTDILARLEALESNGASDILDPEGVEF